MNYLDQTEIFQQAILPLLQAMDIVLVELKLIRTHQGVSIRLLADKAQGGITIEECARLNRQIDALIEAQGMMPDGYTLEVSSPGLDRPLSTREDFARCINKKAVLYLKEQVCGTIQIEGSISKVEEEAVGIDRQGEIVMVPFLKINKAIQIIDNIH